MMASKSLTAVTSFVSVMKEKTVVVLKLNVRGCQRVALPIAIIVVCFLAGGLLVAAATTDQMIEFSVVDNFTKEGKGDLHFSLFRGMHTVSRRNTDPRGDKPDSQNYLIYNVYKRSDIVGVYVTTILAGITVILSAVTAFLAFVNAFQVHMSWLYGPIMLYIFTLFTALLALVTVGAMTDFILWNIDEEKLDIFRSSLELSNLEYLAEDYTTDVSLKYSFWLLVGSSAIPLISIFLSWRLMVLTPCQFEGVGRSFSAFEMSEQQSNLYPQDSVSGGQFYY